MKNRKLDCLGDAAMATTLALILGFSFPAQAASVVTQSAQGVNDFLYGNTAAGNGRFSFSVSLQSTAGADSIAITVPAAISRTGGWIVSDNPGGGKMSYTAVTSGAGAIGYQSGSMLGSGTVSTTGLAVAAPVSSAGVPTTGSYLYSSNAVGSVTGLTNVYFGDGAKKIATPAMSFEVLWGSVEATNQLFIFGTGPSLSGANVLAAAATLGIAGGNSNSYYVTINVIGDQLPATYYYGMAGGGTTFEWMPTSYSTTSRVAVAMPGAATPVGAPAPVIGSTPAGGLLAVGILGFLGLGRRRVAAGARLAA